jgi:hypothetical protein
MASRRKRIRERELQQFHAHQQILTATTIVQIIEEEEEQRPHCGSVVGREIVPRDRYSGYWRLMADYFDGRPVYGENFFCHR